MIIMQQFLKKQNVFISLTLTFIIVFLTACGMNEKNAGTDDEIRGVPILPNPQSQPESPPQQKTEPVPQETPLTLEPTEQIIPQEISTLSVSIEAKIGQMLLVGFRGLSNRDKGVRQIIRDIQKFHLGGVILFDYDMVLKSSRRNIRSPAQVKSLVKQLQAASQIPLFIAIDQEGGLVRRLKEKFGFPPTVSAQYLGEKNRLALTYQQSSKIAKTLANLGINLNFAPVVDLNTNPNNPVIGKLKRSFSADPQIVTRHALEFIKAHHAHGVFCSLKHFPGHGSSTHDSHLGLVDVTHTWHESELEPYQFLIRADKMGIVDTIMVAHVFNWRFDPQYPATLSRPIVTDLLRQRLEYDGVIVSDDMQMKAITSHYRFEVAIQKTLEAGIDLIVIGNNLKYEPNAVARTVAIIKQLIQAGKITEARIEESYQRIQQLKRQFQAD
jgi:beta-N-acetylhexosaminidase